MLADDRATCAQPIEKALNKIKGFHLLLLCLRRWVTPHA